MPEPVAEQIAAALRDDEGQVEHARNEAQQRLEDRRRKVLAKLDRGYEDRLENRISEDFWTRKSEDWEEERRVIDAELARTAQSVRQVSITAERILELAKKAVFLYETQGPAEQRRLLQTVLSNCTFDRGSVCPTYTSPFDLFAKGNETGNWRRGWDSNPRAGYPTNRFRGDPVTTTSVPLRTHQSNKARMYGQKTALAGRRGWVPSYVCSSRRQT